MVFDKGTCFNTRLIFKSITKIIDIIDDHLLLSKGVHGRHCQGHLRVGRRAEVREINKFNHVPVSPKNFQQNSRELLQKKLPYWFHLSLLDLPLADQRGGVLFSAPGSKGRGSRSL